MKSGTERKPARQWDRRSQIEFGRHVAAFCAAALIVVCVHLGEFLRPVDNMLFALRAKLLHHAPSGSVVVVELDPKSLQATDEWPWPRERFARAIETLQAAGAEVIAFDVDFSVRSSPKQDAALKRAIDAGPGTVVLPSFVLPDSLGDTLPLDSLSKAVFAGVNIPVDSDGQVRRYYRGFDRSGVHRPALASVLTESPLGRTDMVLLDYGIRLADIPRLSFEDVYTNTFDANVVRGKRVLVGATALELGDRFATPISPSVPGVYLHALATESLAQNRALIPLRGGVVLALNLAALALLWPRRRAVTFPDLLSSHAAVTSALVVFPFLAQWMTPLSIDSSGILVSQVICLWASINQEVERRSREIDVQRERQLRHSALHNPETDLQNRLAFAAYLKSTFAPTPQTNSAVIAIVAVGINRFATLRGAIGYANANDVIKRVSERLSESLGTVPVFHLSTSIVGAAISAPDTSKARQFCLAAMARLDTRVAAGGHQVHADIHVGVAFSDGTDLPVERLIENATMAVDDARRENRRYVAYEPGEIRDPKRHLTILSGVSQALRANEFDLVYQPKVSIRHGTLEGAEALIRWRHGEFGTISPAEFIPIAEETGAINELTLWTLDRAIADQKRMSQQGVNIILSVNISGRLLSDPGFCETVIAKVKGIAWAICLEITETAIIDDPLAAISSIAAFQDAGLRISIDDYGAGLSSLVYLKQIASDELKIDRSLTVDLTTSTRDRMILKSTIDLAHGLGMSVVVEGIEDEGTLTVLASMGCDYVQGYLISKPLALPDLVKKVKAWSKSEPAPEPAPAPAQGEPLALRSRFAKQKASSDQRRA